MLHVKYMLKVETVAKGSSEQILKALLFNLISYREKKACFCFLYSVNNSEILNILKLFTK